MSVDCFKIRLPTVRQERRKQIDTGISAMLTQRPELLVRQVAAVAAQGSAVGVAGYNRLFGCFQNIPESTVGNMADINDHPKPLRSSDKFFSRSCKTGTVTSGAAGQRIILIPCQVDHANSHLRQFFQTSGITVDSFRAFQR